jgi:hypothetical protein
MPVLTNIGKHISKPKKGEFLYNFFQGRWKNEQISLKRKPEPGDPELRYFFRITGEQPRKTKKTNG